MVLDGEIGSHADHRMPRAIPAPSGPGRSLRICRKWARARAIVAQICGFSNVRNGSPSINSMTRYPISEDATNRYTRGTRIIVWSINWNAFLWLSASCSVTFTPHFITTSFEILMIECPPSTSDITIRLVLWREQNREKSSIDAVL